MFARGGRPLERLQRRQADRRSSSRTSSARFPARSPPTRGATAALPRITGADRRQPGDEPVSGLAVRPPPIRPATRWSGITPSTRRCGSPRPAPDTPASGRGPEPVAAARSGAGGRAPPEAQAAAIGVDTPGRSATVYRAGDRVLYAGCRSRRSGTRRAWLRDQPSGELAVAVAAALHDPRGAGIVSPSRVRRRASGRRRRSGERTVTSIRCRPCRVPPTELALGLGPSRGRALGRGLVAFIVASTCSDFSRRSEAAGNVIQTVAFLLLVTLLAAVGARLHDGAARLLLPRPHPPPRRARHAR